MHKVSVAITGVRVILSGLLPSSPAPGKVVRRRLYFFISPFSKFISVLRAQTERQRRVALCSKQTVNLEQSISKTTGQSLPREITSARRLVCIDTTHYHSGMPTSRNHPVRHLLKDSIGRGNLLAERTLQLPCCSNSTSVWTEKIKRQQLLTPSPPMLLD